MYICTSMGRKTQQTNQSTIGKRQSKQIGHVETRVIDTWISRGSIQVSGVLERDTYSHPD